MDSALHDFLAIVGASIATGGAVGSLLKISVINPLTLTIKELRDTVQRLGVDLKEVDEKRGALKERVHNVEIDVKALEEKAENIYFRLSGLDKETTDIFSRLLELERKSAGLNYGRRASDTKGE